MKVSELKTRIADTLNLDVITTSSLVTCINNCFADIQSRGYREFTEVLVTEDKDGNTLEDLTVPVQLSIPDHFRRLTYLKVETDQNWYDAARINLASMAYKGMKDHEGKERIFFDRLPQHFAYYIMKDIIFVDSRLIGFPIKQIALGYHKELARLDRSSTTLDSEIAIRDDLADALVLYGVYFYSTRTSLDPELSKTFLDRYRYFVEDILNSLYAEDSYESSNNIKEHYTY